MARRYELTDNEWLFIKDHIPKGKSGEGKRGRPRVADRQLLNGMLWLLRTGAPWEDLPERYGAKSTVYRRFREWEQLGFFAQLQSLLHEELMTQELVDDRSWQMDSTHAKAHRSARGAPKKKT